MDLQSLHVNLRRSWKSLICMACGGFGTQDSRKVEGCVEDDSLLTAGLSTTVESRLAWLSIKT